jgi:hypothetical protein
MPRHITILSGPRSGQDFPVEDTTPQAPGGTNAEGKQETVNEAVERMAGSGDASHSSFESSTAGRIAQSTDHMNQY